MKRLLLYLSLPIVLLPACSEPPTQPARSLIDGHWLYNPGQCNEIIDPQGMFDLKISERKIHFGDSEQPAEGKWIAATSDSATEIKKRIGEWRGSCDSFSAPENVIADAEVFEFDGKYQQATFLNYGAGWFMTNEDELFWLVPFDSVKNSDMPVKTIETNAD